jgi:hypothetical protein
MGSAEDVFFLLLFVFLFVAWVMGGGPGSIQNQNNNITVGPGEILGNPSDTSERSGKKWYEYLRIATSSEEDTIATGDASTYRHKVSIVPTRSNVRINTNTREYITITYSSTESSPVDITDWAVESEFSNVGSRIGLGSTLPSIGVVNTGTRILLSPGDSAVINTGPSPVGISFRENLCTGYLDQYQKFYPTMTDQCPEALPSWLSHASEIDVVDKVCEDELATVGRCVSPETLPGSASQSCEQFVTDELFYGGCINKLKDQESFYQPAWRVYLGLAKELYGNTRDTIWLRDADGLIVDVLRY